MDSSNSPAGPLPDFLRRLIDKAGTEEAQRRRQDARLRPAPRFERLPDDRYVMVINSISDMALYTAAPQMAHLLHLSAAVLAKEPGSDAFKLSAEITGLLRQIRPE